jgi:hypothetical protein
MGPAPEQIRNYLDNSNTVPDVFHALDIDGDGKVSLAELSKLGDVSIPTSPAGASNNLF